MPSPGIIQNSDGLTVQMAGDYQKFNAPYVNRLRSVNDQGPLKWYVMDIDLKQITAGTTYYPADLNNDGTRDGFHTGEAYLPQGAAVTRAYAICTEAGVGGTSFTVGTYSVTGAAISATSIMTATEGVIANIAAIGDKITCNGALTSATQGTDGLSANGYVAVSVVGTFTAGKMRLYIEVSN